MGYIGGLVLIEAVDCLICRVLNLNVFDGVGFCARTDVCRMSKKYIMKDR